jgi:putative ABC transport system substrate-binding protein
MTIDIVRRAFVASLGTVAAAWPLTVRAQPAQRVRHVGVLTPYNEQDTAARDDADTFIQQFKRIGWNIGQNLDLQYRAAGTKEEQLRSAASELAGLKPEVILVMGSAALKAMQASTDTIPIVFVGVTDPVYQGFVANRTHPGGNVTGFSVFEFSLGATWVQLLGDVSPGLRRVAVVYHRETTPGGWLPLIQSAASRSNLEVSEAPVLDDVEIDNIIAVLKTTSGGGLIVLPSAFTLVHRQRIIDFAAHYRLPSIYWDNRFVDDGGLMSYSYNLYEQVRQGVAYVDRILKGEKAGDLPVQDTTKFNFVINLKTAKALGLTVPGSLLGRADAVVE